MTLVVEESVHVIFYEHNSPSRNIISDDVKGVEQSLEKLDIQPSSNEIPQNEDELQEISPSHQTPMKVYLGNRSLCTIT